MQQAEILERLARLCSRDDAIPPIIEPTGLAELDALLPGRGWRSGTIVELMPTDVGIGELRLLMPALAHITHSERYVALITPPYIPFASALTQHGVRLSHLLVVNARTPEDILWSFEQILRCPSFGAAIAWPAAIKDREIRRLQLAAEAGRNTGFIYRSPAAAHEASPAAVRMKLQLRGNDQLSIDILKCRGARAGVSVAVSGWPLHASLHPRHSHILVQQRLAACKEADSGWRTADGKRADEPLVSDYPPSAIR